MSLRATTRPETASPRTASRENDRASVPARERSSRLVLPAILLAGLAFRLWGITWGLQNARIERRPHPDEWVIYWLFHWFDRAHNLNPCPRYPGQCFFDWGSVFPYLAYIFRFVLAPFLALLPSGTFGPQADPTFVHAVLAARIVSALASTAAIYVAYRLGALAFGRGAGLLGAVLAALSGLLIQLAHFATPDSTTILLMSLALLAIYRMATQAGMRRVAVAGALVGAAAGSEYHMVLLAVPFLVGWWLSGRRSAAELVAAAGAAVTIFLILNIYLVVDLRGFTAAIEHTLQIRTVQSGLQYGDRWAPYEPSWLYVVRFPLGYGVGFAAAAWMILGLVWAAFRRTRADLVLLAWVLPYFLVVTLEPAKFMRYSAPLLVPLAILAGRFALDLYRLRGRVPRAVLFGVAAAALAFMASYDAAYAGLFSTRDSRAAAISWVNAHAARGQSIAFEELPDGLLTMPYFLRGDLRACFLQQQASRLGGANYVLLDSYAREELSSRANAQNDRLRAALAASPDFRQVAVIDDQPTFLGLRFSIAGSPHDWRYPSHRITIFERVTGRALSSPYCFSSSLNGLQRAGRKLYIPPAQR